MAINTDGLKTLFPEASPVQVAGLQQYAHLLRTWNRRMNLISRQDVDHIWEHHILPSIIALKIVEVPQNLWIMDIGSGGGLPALPIKILRPDLEILMVESIRKKTLFLKKAIHELDLRGISVVTERVESLHERLEFQNRFHMITARAVASIDKLFHWGKPLLQPTGSFLLWKGESDIIELRDSSSELGISYQVITIPSNYHPMSLKFKELCWFLLRSNE